MNSPLSDFQFREKISVAAVVTPISDTDAIRLAVPRWLPERRIYLYVEVGQSAAAGFRFDATVAGFNQGRPIIALPANIADFSGLTANQSVATAFNAGGSPVGDSLVVRLSNPFVPGVNSAVIQPVRVNAEIDEIILSLKNLSGTNITGWRAYLACLSTKF
jgi:hypothetical protein